MLEGCGGCCVLLILIPLICCVAIGGVAYYVYTHAPDAPVAANFKPSGTDARAFQAELDRAVAQARTQRSFYLRFTEQQLSSWMALEGQAFASQQGLTFPFQKMQVGLDDGLMTFYGELTYSALVLPLAVEVQPQIGALGGVEFTIHSVDVGGIQAPDFVVTVIGDQFRNLLVQPFEELPGNVIFYRESLTIDDGVFTVQGLVN